MSRHVDHAPPQIYEEGGTDGVFLSGGTLICPKHTYPTASPDESAPCSKLLFGTYNMRTDVASVSHDREEVELKDRSDDTAIVNQATKDGILSNISELDGRHHESLEAQQDADLSETLSTPADGADMRRMGKEQRLIRRFRPLSITSFTAIATASWELGIFVITPGLTDGGRAGLLWNAIWCFLGFAPIYLSMAEMASMAPIAGAQYHWVSEFAPESCQRSLSYFTG